MREIKFRAWNKEQQVMVYKNEDEESDFWDGVRANTVELINSRFICPAEYIYMQYTGLKDKNGKEIYEGDIVEYEDEVNGVWAEYFGIPIIYSNEYAMFCFKDDEGNLLNIYRNLKVIGNIYEDEELLEV